MNLSECVWHHNNCRDFGVTGNIARLPVNRLSAYTIADQPECPNGYAKPDLIQSIGEKNNVILIMLDDLDEMVTPYLETMPFLRSLVETKAIQFENTYSSTSICCAARCQMLTGRYGHNIGVIGNGGIFGGYQAFSTPKNFNGTRMKDHQGRCYNFEDFSLPVYLEKAGYRTGYFGKYINSRKPIAHIPPGWTDFHIGINKLMYAGYGYNFLDYSDRNDYMDQTHYGTDQDSYITDVLSDLAQDFIQKSIDNDKPFFAYIAPTAPHLPIMPAERHRHHLEYWLNEYDRIVANRESYYESDLSDKSGWLQLSRNLRYHLKQTDLGRNDFAKRITSLYAVDEMLERLYRDDTYIILTSDNGYNYGSHGFIHKMTPYEESIRVPLYIIGPNTVSKNVEQSVMLSDLMPTILDMAGFESDQANLDTMSLMPWVRTEPTGCSLFTRSAVDFDRPMLFQYGSYAMANYFDEGLYLDIYLKFHPVILSTMFWPTLLDVPPYRAIKYQEWVLVEWWTGQSEPVSDPKIVDHIDIAGISIIGQIRKFKEYYNNNGYAEYELYNLSDDPHQLDSLDISEHQEIFRFLKAELDRLSVCKGRECYRTF
jgi:arylsulfatase A-like enzyme